MEWSIRHGVLCFLVASLQLLKVDCIVFEINNMDINRVVYQSEINIKMTCSEENITNPQFEIKHGSSLVQETDNVKLTNTTQSLELWIQRVTLMDGGEYTCVVRSMDGSDDVTESLTLNVQSGGTHCVHNDSSLDWNEGDIKNLSCYYTTSFTDDFQWNVSNSSSSSFPLVSSSLYRDVSKHILFALIGPLKSSDNGNTYRCSHSTDYPQDSGAACIMLGPITVNPKGTTTTQISANTMISTSKGNPSQPGSSAPTSSKIPTITSRAFSTSSSTSIATTPGGPGSMSTLVIVIITVVCVLIVLSCVICLFVLCKRRNNKGDMEHDTEMVANDANSTYDGYLKPDAHVLPTGKTNPLMTATTADFVKEKPSDEEIQVGDEYDKLDHNRGTLHNHSTRLAVPAATSKLLNVETTQNDNEYDKLDHSREKFQGQVKRPVAAARGNSRKETLSDEKNDFDYDAIDYNMDKVKSQGKGRGEINQNKSLGKPSSEMNFQQADAVYENVNENSMGREKKTSDKKDGETDKAKIMDVDIQEMYAVVKKTKTLERSKENKKQTDDAVLY